MEYTPASKIILALRFKRFIYFCQVNKPFMTTTFVANTVILTTIIVCIAIARDLMKK